MRVEVNVLESGTEPGVSVQHQPALMMALRAGYLEAGSRRSEMMRFTFGAGEMCLVPHHVETWLRTDELRYLYLSVDISDAALAAACDGARGDGKLVDTRIGALAGAVNAEEFAGFPSGRLFLDSVEQALAVALVSDYTVRHHSVQTHRGGIQ
jgi:AraC family transcriptional regulator